MDVKYRRQGDPTCRRVPKMEWVGLENYEISSTNFRVIEADHKEIREFFDGDPETIAKMPRASREFKALVNNAIWLIMFQVAIPIGLALAILLNQSAFMAGCSSQCSSSRLFCRPL